MTVDDILIEATKKLININSIQNWKDELLSKAPPVLWFGDSKSEKPKILTVGANPSRWEFLNQTQMKQCSEPYQKNCYENKYLLNKRFLHLSQNQSYENIIIDRNLRKGIVESYDKYFKTNPYRWFGTNKINSYNVEGVLRGMEASYFDLNSQYRSCHIDIFPFATISDFNKVEQITHQDILDNSWAKNIVDELFAFFSPKKILIFGRNNFHHFCNYFGIVARRGTTWKAKKWKGKCDYWNIQYNNYHIIGVSVNLGNPKGFDANGLNELGRYLKDITSAL